MSDPHNLHTLSPTEAAAKRRNVEPEGARALRPQMTVTVTGPRGAGKSTLIAALSSALDSNGHHVEAPKPPFTLNLEDLFNVKIVEGAQSFGPEVDRDLIARAFAILREAAVIDNSREAVKAEVDVLRKKSMMLQTESDARVKKAEELVYAAFGHKHNWSRSATSAARDTTALDRLAAANVELMDND